ncbi:hypothetical protein J6590_101768, partial [Homalodisca vitripennis]
DWGGNPYHSLVGLTDGITARLNSMYLSEVSISEVETAVRRMRSTNAAGVDEIPCT